MSTPINLYRIFEFEILETNPINGEISFSKGLPLDHPFEWFVLRFESMAINSKNPKFKKAYTNGVRASQMCLPIKPIPVELPDGRFAFGEYELKDAEALMAHLEGMIPKQGEVVYFQDITCDTESGKIVRYLDANSMDSFRSRGVWNRDPKDMGRDDAKMLYSVTRSRVIRYNDQTIDDFVAQGFLDLRIGSISIPAEERAARYWNDLTTSAKRLSVVNNPYVYLLDVVRIK